METAPASRPLPGRAPEAAAARYALALLALTSVHHAYGGFVYRTPWRYHVLLVAGPAALAIAWTRRRLRRSRAARAIFVATTLLVPVLAIGLVEGLYNHAVKDALWALSAPPAWMARLFPPPTYEMPNDLFFEATGVAQAPLGALAGLHLARLLRRDR